MLAAEISTRKQVDGKIKMFDCMHLIAILMTLITLIGYIMIPGNGQGQGMWLHDDVVRFVV